MTAIRDLASFNAVHEAGLSKLLPPRPRIAVGMGTCGSGNGAEAVMHAFAEAIDRRGLDFDLVRTGCFGFCAEEPLVNIRLSGQPLVILHRVRDSHVERILDDLCGQDHSRRLGFMPDRGMESSYLGHPLRRRLPDIPLWNEVPFFRGQKKIVLRNTGLINPDDIEEYIAVGGYQALYKVLIDGAPEAANAQIKESGLRGRGGAGFSTGAKWEFLRKAVASRKFLICNADEGDPGAYMNRNEIEGDPHSLIEGMAIGAYITGAAEGVIYIRAEYPLAVQQLNQAVSQAREYGLLGKDILGRGFSFDIEVVEGAGAFVCGEETALIASLEGRAGRPRPRPPFPAQKGLWGYPTNINNVETWFNIAPIIARGPAWFAETGSGGELRHQGVFPGRQGQQHRAGRNAAGHAAGQFRPWRRRRQPERASDQGGADRRAVRRMHPARFVRYPGRLRVAGQARRHHGFGRHGGDGRRQLHGRRRTLLHPVHPLGILRQMLALPDGT